MCGLCVPVLCGLNLGNESSLFSQFNRLRYLLFVWPTRSAVSWVLSLEKGDSGGLIFIIIKIFPLAAWEEEEKTLCYFSEVVCVC